MVAVLAGYGKGLVSAGWPVLLLSCTNEPVHLLSCTQCMAAIAEGYGKGLVSAGWSVLLLSYANECRKRSFHLVGTPFLAFSAAFSLEECPLVGGPQLLNAR